MTSSTDSSSFRSECEISTNHVRTWYGPVDHLFDDAVEAVISGCVTEYSFDDKQMRYLGNVKSFDGTKSYEVEVLILELSIHFSRANGFFFCEWRSL